MLGGMKVGDCGVILVIDHDHEFRELAEDVWKLAADLGVKTFIFEQGPNVLDDHIALNRAGIPSIDIIDFDYEHWHKLSDTPDKCSPVAMANVAKVLMAWVQKIK